MLAQVLGVPVGSLSRLELSNAEQEAELRRRAHADPDAAAQLTLSFRHAVAARKQRTWWSGEAAAGAHEWFRPEPQLVWRLKLMRALCGPLSHAACAQAAAAANLPAVLLEVLLCTSAPLPAPLHLCPSSACSSACNSACNSVAVPPPPPPSPSAGAAGRQRGGARCAVGRRGWVRGPLPRLPLGPRGRPRPARRLRAARVLRAAQARPRLTRCTGTPTAHALHRHTRCTRAAHALHTRCARAVAHALHAHCTRTACATA